MQLLTNIRNWEMSYVLIAPISGKLSYNNYWAEKQNIIAGEEIFYIVPNDNGKLIAKAFLPVTRSGKIKIKQKVNLHLENYPDNEYGIIKGEITNISKVPSIHQDGTYYTAEIGLPNGLLTSYKKRLPYYPDMNGQVDIITENMSLLERIFLPIKKLLIEGFD